MNLFKLDIFLLLSEIYFIFALSFLLIFGVILNKFNNKLNILSSIILASITIIFCLWVLINTNPILNSFALNYFIHNSFIIKLFVNIILVILLCYLFLLLGNLKNLISLPFEYIIILLLVVLGFVCLLKSYNLLILYMALELSSLGLYLLASVNKYSNNSVEAGLKYFILGAIASGILLYGIVLVYGFSGFINFLDISQLVLYIIKGNTLYGIGLSLGISLIFIAFLFKLGVAPFHIWLPDIYKGSPLCSVVFFSIIPKVAILGIFINLFFINLDILYFEIKNVLHYFVIISWFIGSFLALYQTNFKRLLAYSSIVHMGFIFLSLNLMSLQGVIFYQLIYLILTLNIFAVLLSLQIVGKNKEILNIYELINLYKLNPYLSLNLLFVLFSFAGLPPLLGFFGKFYILKLAFLSEGVFLLTFVGLFFSIVSSFYYLRIVKLIFIDFNTKFINIKKFSFLSSWIISITLYLNLFAILNLSFYDLYKYVYI